MRKDVAGIVVGALTVIVGLCAWILPFRPVTQSPIETILAPSPSTLATGDRDHKETASPPSKTVQREELEAVINDPDGYTNVRSGPGIQRKVIGRIVDGEVFYVLSRRGEWWQVKTRDGKHGFMHHSRVKTRE